ncbi:MAG TPA: SURF1 family protein [Acidimicrobiales bacterium]
MARARFLLGPKWLLSHLFVVVLIVVMINLGFWQLRRLDEKRDRNDLIESRMDQPEVAVDDLLAADDGDLAVDEARFRRVTATGTYEDDDTVEVRNQSLDGSPGAWLVTPLRLAGGERVGVIRGFVGFEPDGSFAPAPAPEGRVTVTGLVMDPDRLGRTAGRDLEPLLGADGVLPAVVQAETSDPAEPADALRPLPALELSEGPHLSYAVQWFVFSTIGVVGYPLVLRRVVARRGKEVDDAGDAPGGDGTGGGDATAGNDTAGAAGASDDLDRELEELLRKGS